MARKSLRRKPKQARSGETFGVIVEAAAHVLLEHGYAKALAEQINAPSRPDLVSQRMLVSLPACLQNS